MYSSTQVYFRIILICILNLFLSTCWGQSDLNNVAPSTCLGCSVQLSFPVNYGQKVIYNITWSKVSNGVTVATATSAGSGNNQLVFTAGLGYANKITWAGSGDPTSLSLLDIALLDAGNYSCTLQFTDGTNLSTVTQLNTPMATWQCRTQLSSLHKVANATHYILTTSQPKYTAGCSLSLTWTDREQNKVYMKQQQAVSVCDASKGTCQLAVSIYGSSPLKTTMTYCAAWYVGLTLDYVPQCFSIPQLPNRLGLKQFACVNETMFLQCPGRLRVSVIRAMFGDMQRACANNYTGVCNGDEGSALLVSAETKTCTSAAFSSQSYCRSMQPFPTMVDVCTNHPACGVRVTANMAAYCPSAPSTGSYMLMVEYNCVPGPLTFAVAPSQQNQCQHCQQQLTFRYNYADEVVYSMLWTKVENKAILGNVMVMDDSLIYSGNVDMELMWDSSDPASLTFTNLQADDTGTYRCEVYFVSGNYITGQTYLNTTQPLESCKDSSAIFNHTETDVDVTIIVTPPQYSDGCPIQMEWLNCNTSADAYPPDDISNTYSLVLPKFAATRSVVCYCTSWSVGSYVDNSTTSTGLCVTQLPQPHSVTELPELNTTTSTPDDKSSALPSYHHVSSWLLSASAFVFTFYQHDGFYRVVI